MYKTSSALKSEVREAYRGQWGKMILLNIVPSLIVTVTFCIAFIILFVGVFFFNSAQTYESVDTTSYYSDWDDFDDEDDWNELWVSESGGNWHYRYDNGFRLNLNFGGYIWDFLISLLSIGILFTSLDILRNPRRQITPFQDAFRLFNRKDFIPVFLLELLKSIFTFLWTLLFIIPGIVKSLAYSQSQFIYKDLSNGHNQESVPVTFYITESRKLMDGHKGRLFATYLSFVGWFLLIPLTAGLASLWVIPYYNGTKAAFYKDLAKDQFLPEFYEENLVTDEEEWTDF